MIDRRGQQQEALPSHLVVVGGAGRPQRVRVLDDPIALGVHPASVLERTDKKRPVADRVPPYIPRDIDQQLRRAVAQGGFVLLVGDSTAGKTRAAYEAVRALLPDHVLFAPASRDSVTTILPAVLEQRRSIVWLDDLERFLGANGLTAGTVVRMLGKGERQVLVLATMRSAEFSRYGIREQALLDGPQRDIWRAGRDVIELAVVLQLPRRWSQAELDQARDYMDDPRIRAALGQTNQFGLAELLAAGPELGQDWRNAWHPGAHPRGAALVAAAVDCRRAGLHTPIHIDVLTKLAEQYLTERGGPLLRPEPVVDALAWATTVGHGTSSLLLPTTEPGCYLAFDYLIDLPGLDAIPQTTWDTLIEHATSQQALDIGHAALESFQSSVAVTAYQKAAEDGSVQANLALASAVGANGDPARARQLLLNLLQDQESQADSNVALTFRIRRQLANYTGYSGASARAAELLNYLVADQQRELGPDDPETLASRRMLALYVTYAGDAQRATELYTELVKDTLRLFGPDHSETLRARQGLAWSTAEKGDFERAIRLFTELCTDQERILGIDHPRTLQLRAGIAYLVGATGDFAGAVARLRQLTQDRERILGKSHQHTLHSRYYLVHFMTKSGDRSHAARLFTNLLGDWKRLLGPHNPGVFIAQDSDLAYIGQPPPKTMQSRKKLSEFLWTCQQLLGVEHDLTKETQRILNEPTSLTDRSEIY